MAQDDKATIHRRNFLRLFAAGGATAAAAGLLPPGAPQAAADSESEDERRKSRYRVTDDVRAYYRVNSYPKKK